MSRGGRGRRSFDPLGDPLDGLDLDGPSGAAVDPVVSAVMGDGTGGRSRGGADPGEMDLGAFPEPLDPPKGIVTRLFGAEDGLDPRRGDRDLDDDEDHDGARAGRGRMATMAGMGALLLVGGAAAGWWLWQGQDTDDLPVAALDAAADGDLAAVDGAPPGVVPVLQTPERVVMTIPPLTVPSADTPSMNLDAPRLVADATAATDRSMQRRPWLTPGQPTGGADGAAAADAGAPSESPGTAADLDGTQAAAPEHGPQEAGTADGAEGSDAAASEPHVSDPTLADPAMAADQEGMSEATAHAVPDHGEGGPAPDGSQSLGDHARQDHAHDPAHHMASASGTPMVDAPNGEDEHRDAAEQPHAGVAPDAGHTAHEDGVRHRVDLATPEIDLPDVPGLLPVPSGVRPLIEPEGPDRLGDAPPVPSYRALAAPAGPRPGPLRAAPIAALQDNGRHGPVPTIGPDGTEPWRAYAARDVAPPESPRVAIVVRGLGMMADPLQAAVTKLPPEVTLSFTPYAEDLAGKMAVAREAGHEVLLDLPMESDTFPARDPGPMGLLTLLPETDNRDRLDQVLAAGRGYVGVMAGAGGRFATSPDHMKPILNRLRRAGVLYLHQGDTRSLVANRRLLPPLTAVDVVVDSMGYAESVRARLDYMQRLAQARGTAVGVMQATPLNFATLRAWLEGLEAAGVALAPVSAVVARAGGAGAEGSAPGAGMTGDAASHGHDPAHGTPDGHQHDAVANTGEGHG